MSALGRRGQERFFSPGPFSSQGDDMFLRKAVRVSALLAILITLSLWVLSYFEAAYVWNQGNIRLRMGGLESSHYGYPENRPDLPRWYLDSFRGLTTFWTPLYSKGKHGAWSVFVPLWTPAVFFSVILGLSFLPFRRRKGRRRLGGQCSHCGYDFRGTWGRCPECGTEVAPPPPKQRATKEP